MKKKQNNENKFLTIAIYAILVCLMVMTYSQMAITKAIWESIDSLFDLIVSLK